MRSSPVAGRRCDPASVVARSWSRVLGLGLDASRTNAGEPLPFAEVERRRRGSPLSLVVDELRQVLVSVADASSFLMVVTDADGIILWREGSARVAAAGRRPRVHWRGLAGPRPRSAPTPSGRRWPRRRPVQLFSAEHFEQAQHPWYCTAAPIHHPVTGELLGVVDVSGPALTLHPVIGALVETAVKLAESQLWRHHEQRLERLRQSARGCSPRCAARCCWSTTTAGWPISRASRRATGSRCRGPTRLLAVPGLGLCTPERVGEGWLVRPRGAGHDIAAELDLTGPPVLRLDGRTSSRGGRR